MRTLPDATWRIVTRLAIVEFDDDAAVITAIIGVEPTETWRVGDLRHRLAPLLKHHDNGWLLRSPVDEYHTTPDDSVRSLLALLPDPGAFRLLPAGVTVSLSSTVYGLTERPYFFLSSDLVAALAAIGAELDVDTYDLSKVEDTNASSGEDALKESTAPKLPTPTNTEANAPTRAPNIPKSK